MTYEWDDDDGYKSRSQKKRESTALQKRGEELAALSPALWKELPLTPGLHDALREAAALKSREALRRQMQYIGRLMRELDDDEQQALLDGLDALRDAARQDAGQMHRLEALRDELLASGTTDETECEAAISRIVSLHPALDPARLRHLAEAAVADREKKRPPKHARELFRYLRSVLAE